MFNSISNLLITGIYYVLVGIMTFFSIFGVYVLIRYGQNRSLALLVSFLFAGFFLSALWQSYHTLNLIF